jgi:predicted metal-dependent phosphoesterase TrpH
MTEFVDPPTRGGCDLHIHSHFSDGSLSPADILDRAEKADLSAISLTDHDTVAGLDELMEVARHSSVDVVPGVELSCQVSGGRYHVLGYYVDWEQPALVKKLKYYEEEREKRVRKMVDVIGDEFQTELSFSDVASRAGRSLIGKPHVAKAMADAGLVESVGEAFEEYLGEGMLLDEVPKERMGVREAVRTIEDVGGVPVLAHPVHYEESLDLKSFANLGIRGLEVYYPEHSRSQMQRYFEAARDLDWLVTGGSDFHGDVKPNVSLGDVRMPETMLEPLSRAARQSGARHDLL